MKQKDQLPFSSLLGNAISQNKLLLDILKKICSPETETSSLLLPPPNTVSQVLVIWSQLSTFAHVICVTLLSPSLLISHHPSGFHLIVLVIEWKWSGCESCIILDTTNSQTASSWMLLLFNHPWSEIPFHLTMQAINLTRTEGQWHINMEMAVGQHWLIPIVIEVTNPMLISPHSLHQPHYSLIKLIEICIEWISS